MLRIIFGEEPARDQYKPSAAQQELESFIALVRRQAGEGNAEGEQWRTYAIWAQGLIVSLDELEQSQYAAHRFGERVRKPYLEQMNPEEKRDYYRYIYFDKNAFIRIFAVLDKLGTFMNAFFGLQTERMKAHYSFFTVLRNMRERNVQPELATRLDRVKQASKEPMARLRKRRNTEIHYMNSELQDDLKQSKYAMGGETRLENIGAQLDDLDVGCVMVLEVMRLVFRTANRQVRNGIH